MFDTGAMVARVQGGFHVGHEGLAKFVASQVRDGGVFKFIVGTSHSRREPTNPFYWTELTYVISRVLKRICGSRIGFEIIPQRDFDSNYLWAATLLSNLLDPSKDLKSQSIVICDAGKNGTKAAYKEWLGSSVTFKHYQVKEGIHASTHRNEFFLTGSISAQNQVVLCPETLEFLYEWKKGNNYSFNWVQNEMNFKNHYAQSLPNVGRALLVCNDSVLLYKRHTHPGLGQYDIPVVRPSFFAEGKVGKVYYPNACSLINTDSLSQESVIQGKYKNTSIELWDIDKVRLKRSPLPWHTFKSAYNFEQRYAALAMNSSGELPELVDGDNMGTPLWVPLNRLPETEFFRRETLLILQQVLGYIPVKIPGSNRLI